MHSFNSVYSISEIRQIEQKAIDNGLLVPELMQRAGKAALHSVQHNFPQASSLDIVCGKGNNGGDGYVLALLAAAQGFKVTIYALAELNELTPTAQEAARSCIGIENIHLLPYSDSVVFKSDILVDAILGIGAKPIIEGSLIQQAIQAMNQSGKMILALDVPSGLDADQGGLLGETIHATTTITFIGIKRGMMTGLAPNYCGKIICDTLNLPECCYDIPITSAILTDNPLSLRKPADHKGLYGHVLVIGGDKGMGGAVCLAAEAALRTGAGLVTAVTRPEHISALLTRCPEIMYQEISDHADLNHVLEPLLKKATICIIGPGMGDSSWSNALFKWLLTYTTLPVVLDAGALGWLIRNQFKAHSNWVLTPHPGEAANLLHVSSHALQNTRFTSIKAIQHQWGGVIVLKGAGTLIHNGSSEPIQIAHYHNPKMATAGMGDVLSGIIGSLIAQGCPSFHAACQGVWLHAKAGEMASEQASTRPAILAHELFPFL